VYTSHDDDDDDASNLKRELTTKDFLWWLYEHVGSLYRCPLCRRSSFKSLFTRRRRGYKQCNGDCTLSNNCFITKCK